MPILETERMILRPLTADERALFHLLHNDAQVMRYVSDPMDAARIDARFDERLAHFDKTREAWLALVIVEKESGSSVGVTGFLSRWQPYRQAELGFLLHPAYQGRGYGRESTQAVLRFIFERCGYHKATATVTEGNEASFGLLRKLGFRHEGTLRDNFRLGERWCHDQLLGLLETEYRASPVSEALC